MIDILLTAIINICRELKKFRKYSTYYKSLALQVFLLCIASNFTLYFYTNKNIFLNIPESTYNNLILFFFIAAAIMFILVIINAISLLIKIFVKACRNETYYDTVYNKYLEIYDILWIFTIIIQPILCKIIFKH